MTADFKCYPSPQQNTGVFILNGAMYAVIVCDIVLLFFTLSAQLLLFSCSDQRISTSSLSSRLLLFHSSRFASSVLLRTSVHSYIIASTNMIIPTYLFCFSSFLYFSPLISLSHAVHASFVFTTLTVFPSSLRLSLAPLSVIARSRCSLAVKWLSVWDKGSCVCVVGFFKLNLTHQLLKLTPCQHPHICHQH